MKQALIALLMLVATAGRGQGADKDSNIVWRGESDWGDVYQDSTGKEIGIFWYNKGWQIMDTIKLINELRNRYLEARDLAFVNSVLHDAAQAVIYHNSFPGNKKGWETYNRYLSAYIKQLRKYRRGTKL
jgi:hypothetical protein